MEKKDRSNLLTRCTFMVKYHTLLKISCKLFFLSTEKSLIITFQICFKITKDNLTELWQRISKLKTGLSFLRTKKFLNPIIWEDCHSTKISKWEWSVSSPNKGVKRNNNDLITFVHQFTRIQHFNLGQLLPFLSLELMWKDIAEHLMNVLCLSAILSPHFYLLKKSSLKFCLLSMRIDIFLLA